VDNEASKNKAHLQMMIETKTPYAPHLEIK
jgi:hypothetical protein